MNVTNLLQEKGLEGALSYLPLYPQKLALNFVQKWRSLSRYSTLVD
jgi:hypothetical protein